jgi:hypothetical protein
MRTIEIFVSSPAHVQKERAVAGLAAHYEDRRRRTKLALNVKISSTNRPSFCVLLEGDDFLEQIPKTDLCRQWERCEKIRYLESNPFQDLNSFDFEHAALYHGRTKAVGEVLDALKEPGDGQKALRPGVGSQRFWKEFPDSGRRSSSFDSGWDNFGQWTLRHALTRGGGAGDPFDPLAVALLAKFAPARASGCSFARRMVESSVPN